MFIRFNGESYAILLSSDLIGVVTPYQQTFDGGDVPTANNRNSFHTDDKVSYRKNAYHPLYEKASQDERGHINWAEATAITEAEYLSEYAIYREKELIPALRAKWGEDHGWKGPVINLKNDVILYVRDDFDDVCSALSSRRVTA
jgi:hypothetical protein